VLSKTQQHESGLSQHEQNSLSSMSDRLLAQNKSLTGGGEAPHSSGRKREAEAGAGGLERAKHRGNASVAGTSDRVG